MPSLPKEISDFMERYKVLASEVWAVPGGKAYAVKHLALERIATEHGIRFDAPKVIEASSLDKVAVVCVTGHLGDRSDWSFGEASPHNCKNAYVFCMAEKRARDRVTLKLLNTHGALYSEDEADDFKQPRENPHVTRPEDISDGKPNGEIPHVDGTPQPKAKSRELYAELEETMTRFETLPGLLAWAKGIGKEVAALPTDWQETFRRRFAEHRDFLKTQAEAAE